MESPVDCMLLMMLNSKISFWRTCIGLPMDKYDVLGLLLLLLLFVSISSSFMAAMER